MAKIKTPQRRQQNDYPSGRGTGLPAAGVHSPDRRLGKLPIPANMSGYQGSPSTAADMGFSRMIQRVAAGSEEVQRQIEAVPEVSWLKKNASRLEDMGLTPRVVMEMYMGILAHKPRNEFERRLIREYRQRINSTARRIRVVTEAAMLMRPLEEAMDPSKTLEQNIMSALTGGGLDVESMAGGKTSRQLFSDEPEEDIDLTPADIRGMAADSPEVYRNPGVMSPEGVEALASDADMTAKVMSCHSMAVKGLQIALGIAGVFDPTGFFDASNFVINMVCGNYFYAMLDAISLIPYLGDLAKVGYLTRFAKISEAEIQVIKNSPDITSKVAASRDIWKKALQDDQLGPIVAGFLKKIDKTLGGASGIAARVKSTVETVLSRAIESLKAKSAGGGVTGAALKFFQGKLSIDIAKILEAVQKRLPDLYDFIKSSFASRKARQYTVSGAEIKHSGEEILSQLQAEQEGERQAAKTSSGVADRPQSYPIYATGGETEGFDVDLDDDGIADVFDIGGMPSRSRFGRYGGYAGSPLQEARRKKSKKAPVSKLSLTKAMSGDDNELDEFSAVGTGAIGGVILPMGMRTPGRKKDLEDLMPGYKFVHRKG
jgi:hypothetical protein